MVKRNLVLYLHNQVFLVNQKKNIEIEDRKIKTPIRANNNFGSTLSPKQKLASNAPNIDPTEKQDLKIGFNIFFVFDSNIAICVKRLGAWMPTTAPQKILNRIYTSYLGI